MGLIIKKKHLLILGVWAVLMAIIEFTTPHTNVYEIILSLCIAIFFLYSYWQVRKKGDEKSKSVDMGDKYIKS